MDVVVGRESRRDLWVRAAGAAALLALLALTAPRTPPRQPGITGSADARALDGLEAEATATAPFGFGPLPAPAPALDPTADARTLVGIAAETAGTLATDPTSVQAAYTRALAFERLHLLHVARKAWEKVLDLASGTDLGAEARDHLEALDDAPTADEVWTGDRGELERALAADDAQRVRELVDRHRQRVRQWIQDELLSRWAEAARGGDEARATRSLDSTHRLAGVLEQLTGDHLTTDSLAAIDRATGIPRWRLAQGHALYGEARKLHDRQDYEHAGPLFQRAATDLAAGGSPFALWPRLYLAIESYSAPDLPGALADLRALGAGYDPERAPVLDGYVHWILYLVVGRLEPPPLSLADCTLAARRFRQVGEIENQVAMENSAAETLLHSGDLEGAWEHLDRAFGARGALGISRHSENTLWVAIDALRAAGQAEAALPLSEEQLEEAEARGNSLGLSLALRKRGEILTDLGADEAALNAHLDEARRAAEEIPDPQIRRSVESEALIARGRARCTYDPAQGLADLDRAESFFVAAGYRHRLIEVFAERGRCRRSAGDPSGAEADLTRALGELESQRRLIHDPDLRTYYVDESRAVLEERVALALERGDEATAFSTVERLRAPGLLDALGKTAPPAESGVLARSLPGGTTLVDLLSLDREVVAWILGERGTAVVHVPVSRREITHDVRALRRALARGESPAPTPVEARLLKSLLPALGDARSVVIVPDGPLYDLPFAALRDPETKRPLAKRFALSIAPSARAYVALQDRARNLGGGRPRTALAVGGVPFARKVFPALEPLPASETEAGEVAAAYPAGVRLSGADATAQRFLADAPSFDVIHLATHAVDFPGTPEMASLLLAPEPGGPGEGILPARALRFPRQLTARVVVLAACRTAQGRISASEGPLNLARPFLAAGAPTVVATLWALDETTSLAFSERFHAALAAGTAPIDAFHSAQLALLRSPDPRLSAPRSWAGLVLLGATDGMSRR